MRDSMKWSMIAGLFTMLGIVTGWKASYEQRKETEEDKAYFADVAKRLEEAEGGLKK